MSSENFNDYSEKNPEARLITSIKSKTQTLNHALIKVVPQLNQAANKIVNALLSENKILICANGSSSGLTQYFAAQFINRFETIRPALPAFSLNADNIVIAAINNDANYHEVYSRQILALGKARDILFIFISNELNNSLVQAIEAAHNQEMQVILLCGEICEDTSPYINKGDLAIQLPVEQQPLIYEAQLLSIHSICELIDHLLFGTC